MDKREAMTPRLTITPYHARRVVVLVQAELGDVIEILCPLEKRLDGDGSLQRLAIDQRLLGCGER